MTDEGNELMARILDEVVNGRKAVEDRIDGVASEVAGVRREMLSHFDALYAGLIVSRRNIMRLRTRSIDSKSAR